MNICPPWCAWPGLETPWWAGLSLGRILWTQGRGRAVSALALGSTGSTPLSVHGVAHPTSLLSVSSFLPLWSPQSSQHPGDAVPQLLSPQVMPCPVALGWEYSFDKDKKERA